jgi:glyoxylate reductase
LPEGGTDPLLAAGHQVVDGFGDDPAPPAEIAKLASRVDAIVCLLTDRIDRAVLEAGAAAGLKVVGNVAVGYDNVDIATARELGIAVCNTPGVLDEATADLTFMLILAASRLGTEAEDDLRSGRWHGWGINQYLGSDVFGATLGLVGFGRIGQAVARRAAGFGMHVLHTSRTDTGVAGYVPDLETLITASDVLSLHVPLTPETRHLIGQVELELLGPGGVLVNTSRGPVVDEVALAAALQDGVIFAAGIDVYEAEPTVHPDLLSAPRAVLLPHIGSATRSTRTRMARLACNGVCEILAGRLPENLVVPPG